MRACTQVYLQKYLKWGSTKCCARVLKKALHVAVDKKEGPAHDSAKELLYFSRELRAACVQSLRHSVVDSLFFTEVSMITRPHIFSGLPCSFTVYLRSYFCKRVSPLKVALTLCSTAVKCSAALSRAYTWTHAAKESCGKCLFSLKYSTLPRYSSPSVQNEDFS